MAEDARISTALPSHPKTKKLRRRIGIDGCWSLVCLFLWTASNRWDGNLTGLADEDIELAADWQGQSGAFVQALAEVRFIDGESGGFVIHDWAEHNPWAAARGERVESARKAALARWSGPARMGENMRSACAPHARRMRPTQKGNAPNPTQPRPDQTEEKEKNSSSEQENCLGGDKKCNVAIEDFVPPLTPEDVPIDPSLDYIVGRIGHLYPANSHLEDRDLPQIHQYLIAKAVEEDGATAVLDGTKAIAEAAKNGFRYVPSVEKFFGPERHYLKDPSIWTREKEKAKRDCDLPPDFIPHSEVVRRDLEVRKEALRCQK